jgi:hypothetical protein
MDYSYCLNIPSLTLPTSEDTTKKSRFLFISENEIIHPAGNALQITKLPKSKDEVFSDLTAPTSKYEPVFEESDLGRGFSCLCYNRYRRRVAYSPRDKSPSIFIRAIKGRNLLCKIEEGVKLEYADMCFNQIGSKIAAIGRGEIDATLLVWSLEKVQSEEDEKEKILPFQATLIVKYELKYSVCRCLFSPSDDNCISLLHADTKVITICYFSKFINKFKVKEKSYTLSEESDTNISASNISTIAWEADNNLLIGTSNGSINLITKTSEKMVTLFSRDEMKEYGTVRDIIITASFVIVAFQMGKLVWVNRSEQFEQISTISVQKEISIDDEILEISCDPSFQRLLVFSHNGDLHSHPIDPISIQNIEHNSYGEESSEDISKVVKLGNIQNGTITSLASLVLTGKASVSLLLSGGSDGKVKVLKDSQIENRNGCLQSTLACLDIGIPVTSLETLHGFPVCAVGFADGSLRFVYVGKSKEHGVAGVDVSIAVDMTILKSEVLAFAPITSLAFATRTKKLVAGCYESGQAFVLCAEPTNLHVLGVVETSGKSPLCAISWCVGNPSHLLVGSQSGDISCFDTISMCFSHDPLVPLWEVSLDKISGAKAMATAEYDGKRIVHVAHIDSKGFDSFEVPNETVKAKTRNEPRHSFFSKHSSYIDIKSRLLMVGSMAGEVTIFEYEKDGKCSQIFSKKVHYGPVLNIILSADKSRIYSTSIDGALCVNVIGAPEKVIQSAYEYDYLVST